MLPNDFIGVDEPLANKLPVISLPLIEVKGEYPEVAEPEVPRNFHSLYACVVLVSFNCNLITLFE